MDVDVKNLVINIFLILMLFQWEEDDIDDEALLEQLDYQQQVSAPNRESHGIGSSSYVDNNRGQLIGQAGHRSSDSSQNLGTSFGSGTNCAKRPGVAQSDMNSAAKKVKTEMYTISDDDIDALDVDDSFLQLPPGGLVSLSHCVGRPPAPVGVVNHLLASLTDTVTNAKPKLAVGLPQDKEKTSSFVAQNVDVKRSGSVGVLSTCVVEPLARDGATATRLCQSDSSFQISSDNSVTQDVTPPATSSSDWLKSSDVNRLNRTMALNENKRNSSAICFVTKVKMEQAAAPEMALLGQ